MSRISDEAYVRGLAYAYLAVFAFLAIDPTSRSDWALENLLVAAVVAAMYASRRVVTFSRLSTTSIFVFGCVHELGAHYTYPAVPYDQWVHALTGTTLQEVFGLTRNNYDRLVHLLFGLLMTLPMREVLLQTSPVRGAWSYVMPVSVSMALSAGYEISEWCAVALFGGNLGDQFLGAQGDVWDSQKDMAVAAVGAMIATSLFRWSRNWSAARTRPARCDSYGRGYAPMPMSRTGTS